MSELGDLYHEWNKDKQEKRRRNRSRSAALLTDRGYAFTSRNEGAHLIVTAAMGVTIDFWPGTGKWIARVSRGGHAIRGYGVANLMREFKPVESP